MLTPDELDDYLAPFLAIGADPKPPDLDTATGSQLLGFLFDVAISYEAATVALMHGDARALLIAERTFVTTRPTLRELSTRIRGQWTVSAIEEFLREQAE